jgi:hypothetical protein
VTGTAEYKVCAAEVRRIEGGAAEGRFPGSDYSESGPPRMRPTPRS